MLEAPVTVLSVPLSLFVIRGYLGTPGSVKAGLKEARGSLSFAHSIQFRVQTFEALLRASR